MRQNFELAKLQENKIDFVQEPIRRHWKTGRINRNMKISSVAGSSEGEEILEAVEGVREEAVDFGIEL